MLRSTILLLSFACASLVWQSIALAEDAPITSGEQTLKATVKTAAPQGSAAPEGSQTAPDSGAIMCTSGANTRLVEISFGEKNKLPCQVHYKKTTEKPGEDQIIYSANSDLKFCYEKAAAHVAKLEGMGWNCSKG